MNCFRSLTGSEGWITSTPGGPPKSAMCVKSRSGSNGKFLDSAGPGAVLDDEILLEAFTEPLPHEPPQRVGGAARGKRHDDAHRLCRPGLSVCARRPEPEQRDGDKGRCLGIESHGVFTNPSGSLPVGASGYFTRGAALE